jgi:hypothetical protein
VVVEMIWVNAYAVSERFFFWILIPTYVARNICQNNFRRMNVVIPTCKSSAMERIVLLGQEETDR